MAPQPPTSARKILVTTALPYANGPIHMGHLVEHVQADIWVRYQRLIGNQCYFFCADDTHGTPIFIRAKNEGRSPEALIADIYQLHRTTFEQFGISFDHYSSTNSEATRLLSEEFYQAMKTNGAIHTKQITQTYCPHDKMFLPDRLVKGTCPKCSAENQYGDSCDVCGSTYAPTELKKPACSLCGTPPVLKESDHIFFKLNQFKEFLKTWVPQHASPEVAKKLMEWLKEDLRDWDISRDEPYFGFKIPGYKDKYFYVWVDAPIGYMASSREYFTHHKKDALYEEFWRNDKTTELYHFIGKDIIYFHLLFWPAMLETAGYRKPNNVHVHGFLTVNGEKMSKSKGTFVNAETYAKHLDVNFLRYYYASKLSDGLDDIDLNLEDFVNRVNSDLVGKYVNLGSRSMQMIHKMFGGKLTTITRIPGSVDNYEVLREVLKIEREVYDLYEKRQFGKAIALIRSAVDVVNKFFDDLKPWVLVKDNPAQAHEILSITVQAFRILTVYLTPVIPRISEKVAGLFGETDSSQFTATGSSFSWISTADRDLNDIIDQLNRPLTLQPFSHLVQRVDPEKVQLMIEDSKSSLAPKPAATPTPATDASPYISIDDFNKIDLRIAKVIHAEEVVETDKLLRLKVSLGNEERTILAGIKKAYKPEQLIGRQVLVVANLAPRKMKFGTSEGMVLCASEGESLFVLSPDTGAATGSKVK